MKRPATRWLALQQLAVNISVSYPEDIRDDLVNDAVIQCVEKFKNWDRTRPAFSYFSTIIIHFMGRMAYRHNRFMLRHKPMPDEHASG